MKFLTFILTLTLTTLVGSLHAQCPGVIQCNLTSTYTTPVSTYTAASSGTVGNLCLNSTTNTTLTGNTWGKADSLSIGNGIKQINGLLEVTPSKVQNVLVSDTVTIDSLNIQGSAHLFVLPWSKLIVTHGAALSQSTNITIGAFATVIWNGITYTNTAVNVNGGAHTLDIITCGSFTPLGIKIEYFYSKGNSIYYKLASYEHVSRLELQWSSDARTWEYYQELRPSTWEEQIPMLPTGFYRLRETDLQGTASVSNTVKITGVKEQQSFRYNLLGQKIR